MGLVHVRGAMAVVRRAAVHFRLQSKDAGNGRPRAALLEELVNVAVLASATLSIVTALSRSGRAAIAASLSHWLPPEPLLFREHCREPSRDGDPIVVEALQSAYASLAFARQITLAQLGRATAGKGCDKHWQDVDTIWDAWDRCCGLVLVALLEFDRTAHRNRAEPGLLRAERAASLIRAARAGESPCVMSDGSISIPDWAERRAAARYVVSWPAEMVVRGARQVARICDLGSGGAKLTDVGLACALGDPISVAIAAGRVVTGRIAWSGHASVGVAFDVPLAAEDELLVAASRGLPPPRVSLA